MTLAAPWLCYLPRAFARARDYHVEAGELALPAHVVDAFTVEAEGMLRAGTPGWRYTALGNDRFMALLRCEAAMQGGAQAPVVWALLLPHAHVRGPRCALTPLPACFPPAELTGALPPPLDLITVAPPGRADTSLAPLISRYVEDGSVQVSLAPAAALEVFCGAVEQLAPRDRLEVSFDTTAGAGGALSVAPAAPAPTAVPPSPEGLARLGLWSLVREAAPAHEVANASLRGAEAGWLAACLPPADLTAGYAKLARAVRAQLPQAAQLPALAHLRRALELRLSRLPPAQGAAVLAALVKEGLLEGDSGVPPMWLARVILQCDCLGDLPAALLPRVLSPEAVPMILESVQHASSLPRLASLARALARAPRARQGAPLAQACAQHTPQILRQGVSDQTLAKTVALLLLADYAGAAGAVSAARNP